MDESPEQLLNYFRRLSLEHPDNQEWRVGAEATEAWITLTKADDVSQDDFATLMSVWESPTKAPGPGWFDLWLRVRNWDYERGFSVPETHP